MKAAVASVSPSSSFWCPVFKSCLTFPGLLAWRVLLVWALVLCSLRPHIRAGLGHRLLGQMSLEMRVGKGVCSFIHDAFLHSQMFIETGEWENEGREVTRVDVVQGFVHHSEDFYPKGIPIIFPYTFCFS